MNYTHPHASTVCSQHTHIFYTFGYLSVLVREAVYESRNENPTHFCVTEKKNVCEYTK